MPFLTPFQTWLIRRLFMAFCASIEQKDWIKLNSIYSIAARSRPQICWNNLYSNHWIQMNQLKEMCLRNLFELTVSSVSSVSLYQSCDMILIHLSVTYLYWILIFELKIHCFGLCLTANKITFFSNANQSFIGRLFTVSIGVFRYWSRNQWPRIAIRVI